MFLAFADTLYFGFVKGIYLIAAVTFLRKDLMEESKHLFITFLVGKVAVKFPDQTTGYSAQTSVCLECLPVILGVIAKTPVEGNLFQRSSLTPT